MTRGAAIAIPALLLGLAGCRSGPGPAPGPADAARPDRVAADGTNRPPPTRIETGDAAFARRADSNAVLEAIRDWRSAAAQGDSAALRVRLSRALHFLASTRPPADRRPLYEEGAQEARRALELLGAKAPCGEGASAEAAPALYWLAENLDGAAREAGLVQGAEARREALCLARRAAALAPGHFHAGPLRLLGRMLAQLPARSGGDLAKSREAFEQAIASSPEYLGNRVDFAASWAVKAQDRAAFEQALDFVLAADPAHPEVGPENALAQRRAIELRARVGELF